MAAFKGAELCQRSASGMKKNISYTVKKNHRARRIILRMCIDKGLVLTVPVRFNRKNIPRILDEHREWITESFLQIKNIAERTRTLPDQIILTALNETWHIRYLHMEGVKIRLTIPADKILLIRGDTANTAPCHRLLTRWIRKKARLFLTDCLEANSLTAALPYNRFLLRGQKTRWGSCSSHRCISLNFKLIFLPQTLVQHVVLHELAHTVHLNHSPNFWRLLATLDPNWKQNRLALRRLKKENPVPEWVM